MKEYDLIVVGSGPGGYVAAHKAGELGKSVLLVEKDALGGVCTNWGCIPTKSHLNRAKMYEHAKDSEKMGVVAKEVSFDLKAAMAWKQDTIDTLKKGIEFLMKNAKVDVVFGEALATAKAMGWSIKREELSTGLIDATDTTFWYGFQDDITIRLSPSEGGGTIVDVRSLSRVGGSDLGKNAARVGEFLERLSQ